MAIATLVEGATFQDLQDVCRPRGIVARDLGNGRYSIFAVSRRRTVKSATDYTTARNLANYYMKHCGVAVAVARFELKQHHSRLKVKDFLYKVFLDDLQNGNEFADFLKTLSLYKEYHGKMHRFKGNIPFLDD